MLGLATHEVLNLCELSSIPAKGYSIIAHGLYSISLHNISPQTNIGDKITNCAGFCMTLILTECALVLEHRVDCGSMYGSCRSHGSGLK